MEPGSLVLEDGTVAPPDSAEQAIRPLYELPSGAGMRLSLIRAADGSAVGIDGSSRSLNGPEDLRILRVTRSLADVVIVGGRTARAESYGDIRLRAELLAARGSPPPDLAIVTHSGAVPNGLDPERTWIVTTANAPAASMEGDLAGRLVIAGEDSLDPALMVTRLQTLGYRSLLCEGGPALAELMVAADVVTDYCLTPSPLPAGDGARVPRVPDRMRLAHTLRGGGYTMERWTR